MAELLRTEIDRQGKTARLVLHGELDLSTVDLVRDQLTELQADPAALHVILDLRGVSFIDSTGIAMVLTADANARRNGHNFAVVKGPPMVHRVFVLTRMDDHLVMVDDPEDLSSPS